MIAQLIICSSLRLKDGYLMRCPKYHSILSALASSKIPPFPESICLFWNQPRVLSKYSNSTTTQMSQLPFCSLSLVFKILTHMKPLKRLWHSGDTSLGQLWYTRKLEGWFKPLKKVWKLFLPVRFSLIHFLFAKYMKSII